MTDPDVTLCVLGSKPHRATVGYVCEQHLQRLADTLRDIEDEAAMLSAVPSMAMRSGRGGSLKSTRSPAVLDAIVATDRRRGQVDYSDEWALDDTASVLGTLHSWAQVVREDRKLAPPMRRVARVRAVTQPYIGPFCAEDCLDPSCERMSFWLEEPAEPTVSGERDTLSRSLSWVAAQPWVDDFNVEMRALLSQLRATNGTAEPKSIARCHHCEGPIRVDTLNGYAFCAQCRATWTGPQLIDLAAIAEEARRPRTDDGRAMMTVAQIVEQFGGNANSVRVRLSRAGVKGVDGHYDTAVFEGVSA